MVSDSDPQRLLAKLRAANQGGDVHLVGGPRTIETFRVLGSARPAQLVVLPLLFGGGMQLTPSLSPDSGLTFASSPRPAGRLGGDRLRRERPGERGAGARGGLVAGLPAAERVTSTPIARRSAGGLRHSDGVSTSVRNRPPSPGGVARALRPRRALVIAGLLLLVLLGAAAAAAYIDDQSHRDHIAPGARIGGVDVGGISVDAARARLIQRAVAPRRRTLTVHGAGRTFVLRAGPEQADRRSRRGALASAGRQPPRLARRAGAARPQGRPPERADRAEAPLRPRRAPRAGDPSRRGRSPGAARAR